MKRRLLEERYKEIRQYLTTPLEDGTKPTLIMAEEKFNLSHEYLCRLRNKWRKQGLINY